MLVEFGSYADMAKFQGVLVASLQERDTLNFARNYIILPYIVLVGSLFTIPVAYAHTDTTPAVLELAVASSSLVITPKDVVAHPPPKVVVVEDKVAATTTLPQSDMCSCVTFLRDNGVNMPTHLNASDFVPNSAIGVGKVALFNYSGVYHVALVTTVAERSFQIVEANYHHCKSDTRTISLDDPHLRGFWGE